MTARPTGSPDMTAGVVAAAWAELQSEAVAIVAAAKEQGVTLRVVGSGGIRLRCAGPGPLMDRLGPGAKDIDFIVPQRHRKGMRRVLEGRGYVIDRDLLIAMEGSRYSFAHRQHGTEIDVFVEKLDFCHTIEVAGRLAGHPVTIPIEELLLQKLQIVQMTTTDLIDASVLLATHDVAASEDSGIPGNDTEAEPAVRREVIDAGHIARLLARDWGFHHTATRNMERVRQHVASGATAGAGQAANARAEGGAARLLAAIDAEPKTLAWRMRDKIGERKQWWQDVDDRQATY